MKHRISPDCVLDIPEEENKYNVERFGIGEFVTWTQVLGVLSKGNHKSGDICPQCSNTTIRIEATGNSHIPNPNNFSQLDVCLDCKLQSNYIPWICGVR